MVDLSLLSTDIIIMSLVWVYEQVCVRVESDREEREGECVNLLPVTVPKKPRFRSANLLITHVLDTNISSPQGRSVDLSVAITTGRRSTMDII